MSDKLFLGRYKLPVILQAERSECGLACLAMVAGRFGHRTDLNTLRREHEVSARGSSLTGLISIASALQMDSRPVKLDLDDLQHLSLPAILHWDMDHFVVLKSVSRKHVVIHDPAVGVRRYQMSEVSRHFTGVAVELTPKTTFTRSTRLMRSKLSELFERYPGFYRAVSQLFVLTLMIQIASIGSAFYMQLVIDEALAKQDLDFLRMIAIGFFMLALTSVGLNYARSQVQLYFSNQLGFQMVGNVFHHLMGLPVSYFEKRHVGDLVSRFGSIREIRRIITEDLITAVLDGLFAIVTLGVMFWFHPTLASVVLLLVSLAAIIQIALIPAMQRLQEQKIVADAKTSSNLMENMRAIEVIKFYCRELPRIVLWRNHYASQINTNVALTRFGINIEATHGLIFGLETILIVYLGATFVLKGEMTLGFLTAFIALKGNFSNSTRSLIEKLVQIRLVRLQLERLSDITCTEREFPSLHMSKLRRPLKGELQLQNISYTYPGASTPVIRNLDLSIGCGQVIAISGASGAGKSTLLKIMCGLLPPDEGSISVDGIDIQQLGLRNYRDACAGVLQTDQLLSGSIADNITLFSHEVDFERMQWAAAKARVADFVAAMPMAYNSQIGDMGSIMSAGQAQRLLLARTFYKNPRLLFLDEATANLDPANEEGVLRELRSLNITTVLVTHRPAALAFCDRVLVFCDGRLEDATVREPDGSSPPAPGSLPVLAAQDDQARP